MTGVGRRGLVPVTRRTGRVDRDRQGDTGRDLRIRPPLLGTYLTPSRGALGKDSEEGPSLFPEVLTFIGHPPQLKRKDD